MQPPSVTSREELTEGQRSTLECSTPYVCPGGDIVLHWQGYDPRVSDVSGSVQMDTTGVGHQVNLSSSFSWKDHGKKLLCEVSVGSARASTELVLRVRRTWGGDRGHFCHCHPLQCFPPASPSFCCSICPSGATHLPFSLS